ncbi:MAG: glycosyltransferase family 39 protein, partial [Deltaproteobacteria bacterium]|nr:glycosyltransferase family 39 protein [Deltaproteobacteria bacterium]
MAPFAAMVAAGVAVRILDFLTLPIIENDGVNLMMSALNTLAGQGISPSLTLPSMIAAAMFSMFGEGLWPAALPNLLAGLGIIALCLTAGKAARNRETGVAAAGLYAVCALAMFYAPLPKPYALLAFFVFAGVVCWAVAIARSGRAAVGFGLLSGLAFGAAFATHTFAAFAAVPLPFIWAASFLHRDWRSLRTPTLFAGLGFGSVAGLLIAWRFPAFGWSIFNDYLMDWRFEIAIPVWSVRWEGLTNLYALSPFAFAAPLGAYFAARRTRTPIEKYALAVIALNLAVYLLNPVNRFPRVLLTSMAPLALLAAIGLADLVARRSAAIWAIAFVSILGLALVGAEASSARLAILGMLDQVQPFIFALVVAGLLTIGFVAGRARSTSPSTHGAVIAALAAFAFSTVAFAAIHTRVALSRQAELYQRRVAGLAACGTTSDTLGGGDGVHLLLRGTHNYSWLVDLPRERLLEAYATGVVDALEAEGVRCVVVDWKDPEGEVAMLDEFVRTAGVPPAQARNLFQELDEDPHVRVIAEQAPVSTYGIGG